MTHPTDRAEAMREACAKVAKNGAVAAFEEMTDAGHDTEKKHTYSDCMEAVGKALSECQRQIETLPLPAAPAHDAVRPKCRCGCDDGMHDAGRPGTRRCKSPKCGCVDFQPPRPAPDAVREAAKRVADCEPVDWDCSRAPGHPGLDAMIAAVANLRRALSAERDAKGGERG